jgi:hypothetical protein
MPKPGESIGTVKVDEIVIVSLGNKLSLKKREMKFAKLTIKTIMQNVMQSFP